MIRLATCLTEGHDWRLVFLAALTCLIASIAAILMLGHAAGLPKPSRGPWLFSAGAATGFGIWATHFIGMLTYAPELPIRYDITLTIASLSAAVLITWGGLGIAVRGGNRAGLLGGAVIGIGIVVMHLFGVASFDVQGEMVWDVIPVMIYFVIGIALASLALWAANRGHRLLGGALLGLAIAGHHFAGMSTLTVVPDPNATVDALNYGTKGLALAIVGVAVSLFGTCLVVVLIGQSARTKIERVSQNLELALANMSQGLCLFDKTGHLVLANQHFAELVGMDSDAFPEGLAFAELTQRIARHHQNNRHNDIDPFEAYHRLRLTKTQGAGIIVALGKEQVLSLTHSPMAGGGWVMTCDDVTDSLRTERQIAHMANHDSLTDLPNRPQLNAFLQQSLDKADAEGGKVALLGIDLNRFKEVNDQYGHAAGDALLKALAQRMADIRRPGEMFGRMGGDEFAAVKCCADRAEVLAMLKRIQAEVFLPVPYDGIELMPSGSIGIALYPDDASTLPQLVIDADLAMYRAKTTPGQLPCFYEASMDEAVRSRRALSADLWIAIERREFFVHYQVQKSIQTGHITGYEALVRWRHPTKGAISPADFIPVAEECGAIGKIGEWVLRQACIDAVAWLEPHKVAVNLSPLQFAHRDLAGLIRDTLDATGLPASRLELEITETSIIADKPRALALLNEIKALGVSIAIDDFGTGYSSLDTLNAFPFDRIKIDRSFLVDVDSRPQSGAIIRAVLALGQSLGMPVLAEGIETQAQLNMLRREGCTEGQGFLLGRPMAPSDVETTAVDPVVRRFPRMAVYTA